MIEDAIKAKDYDKAMQILDEHNSFSVYKELLESVYECLVEDAMDNGDYVGAPEILNEHNSMSAYDRLYDSIKYENILIACMMDYRAYLYFPESLSVLSADFYKCSAGYPAIISEVSGQVRAEDFDLFTRSELYVIFDPDHYDHAVADDFALREFQRDACNAINECQNSSQKSK